MIVMEGLMMVPPDRGSIIGRAVWKTRHIVLGTEDQTPASPSTNNQPVYQNTSAKQSLDSRRGSTATSYASTSTVTSHRGVGSVSRRTSRTDVSEDAGKALFLSVYKVKAEVELVSKQPLAAFKSCEVRLLSFRREKPSTPTLILELKPEPPTDKQRKRRSSRASGLSIQDPWATMILFRPVPDERYGIADWQAAISAKLRGPDEPFTLPERPQKLESFVPQARRVTASSSHRPDFSRGISSPSVNTSFPRDRSAIISPSPSLKSRRSDLSSRASLTHGGPYPLSHTVTYSPTLQSDLPSPASTIGNSSTLGSDSQLIEGWTSAQGRSSALSTHTRGSNSMTSAIASPSAASSPPAPRETILDRAFQMRFIPGGDRYPDLDEEKVSSTARFEALMREADEQKLQTTHSDEEVPRRTSNWTGLDDDDDSSEDSEAGDMDEMDEEDDDELESPLDARLRETMPTPAQRALDYIAGRPTTLRPRAESRPLPAKHPHGRADAAGPTEGHIPEAIPRVGTTSFRRNANRPSSVMIPRSQSTSTIPNLKESITPRTPAHHATLASTAEKDERAAKRLSFNEFARRLSSTSSLLLVQTNSSASGREGSLSRRSSSDYGNEGLDDMIRAGNAGGLRNSVLLNRNSASGLTPGEKELRDARCGWRGSVGVFGGEGGFV